MVHNQSTGSISSQDSDQRLDDQAIIKERNLEETIRPANVHKPKLNLPSKETYSNEERMQEPNDIPRHLRPSEEGKCKNAERRQDLEEEKPKSGRPARRRSGACERLYALSTAKQIEGKVRREEIKRSNLPPPPVEFKTMPLSQATDMYKRGMIHLISKEMKFMKIAHEREGNYESVLIPESGNE